MVRIASHGPLSAARLSVSFSFDVIDHALRFRIPWQWMYDFHWSLSKGNLRLHLCLIRNLSMTLGVEVYLHTFLTSTLCSVDWKVSYEFFCMTEKGAFDMRLTVDSGSHSRSGFLEKGKFSFPCLESNYDFSVVQPPALVLLGCRASRTSFYWLSSQMIQCFLAVKPVATVFLGCLASSNSIYRLFSQ